MARVCVEDFEEAAHAALSSRTWNYVSSGATTEHTLRDNVKAYSRYVIRPKVLVDVSQIDMKTSILGEVIDFPIGLSPTAMHRLAHPEAEKATARAAAKMNTCMIHSLWSTTPLEEVAVQNGSHCRWQQMYLYEEKQVTVDVVRRAERAGYKALVITVDSTLGGIRYSDARDKFSVTPQPPHIKLANLLKPPSEDGGVIMSNYRRRLLLEWEGIDWLRSVTSLPIVLKGIMTAEDAREALKHSVQGIIVSNHGARKVDGVPATIDVLPEIVRAVNGQIEVYLDGGIRHGTDVLKALALGAKAVFVGRPVLWGLAVEGEKGVCQVLSLLKEEFRQAMVLSGCANISAITSSTGLVVHRTHYTNHQPIAAAAKL